MGRGSDSRGGAGKALTAVRWLVMGAGSGVREGTREGTRRGWEGNVLRCTVLYGVELVYFSISSLPLPSHHAPPSRLVTYRHTLSSRSTTRRITSPSPLVEATVLEY